MSSCAEQYYIIPSYNNTILYQTELYIIVLCYATHYFCTVRWARFCIWAQQSIKGEARGAPPPQRLHRSTECLAKCRCTGQTPLDPGWGGGKATPHPYILPPLVCTYKTKSQERGKAFPESQGRKEAHARHSTDTCFAQQETQDAQNAGARPLSCDQLGGARPLACYQAQTGGHERLKAEVPPQPFQKMLHRPAWSVHAPVRLPASKLGMSLLTSTVLTVQYRSSPVSVR